jgi:hypothetical protein
VKAVEVKEEDRMISLHMGAGGQELQVRGHDALHIVVGGQLNVYKDKKEDIMISLHMGAGDQELQVRG